MLRINFSDWLYSLWHWINITQSVLQCKFKRRAAPRTGKSGKAFVRCIFIRFFPVKFQTIKRADFSVSIDKNLRNLTIRTRPWKLSNFVASLAYLLKWRFNTKSLQNCESHLSSKMTKIFRFLSNCNIMISTC